MDIGIIGLGEMGVTIAEKFLEKGYKVFGYNRTRVKAEDICRKGVIFKETPSELVSCSDFIIISLAGDKALKTVFWEQGGILGLNSLKNKIIADFSTVSPGIATLISEKVELKNGSFLSVPVSGNPDAMREERAAFYVGGDKNVYIKALPFLNELSKKTQYVGSQEDALKLKLIINAFLFTQFQAYCEVLCLSEKIGLNRDNVIDMINQSVTSSPLIRQRSSYFKKMPATGLANIEQVIKDIDLIDNLSDDYTFNTLDLAKNSFQKALDLGLIHEDFYGVYKAFKKDKI